MIFKNIAILDDTFQIRENQYVQIRQDKIVYIGEQMPETGSEEEFDGKDKLMIPGMVNTHTHVPMTLLRGYGENLPLDRWLNERIVPYEHQLDADSVYDASLLGIAEMLMFGVTSFTEMYDFCGDIARAALESGICANISRGVLCFDDSSLSDLQSFRESRELYENWNNVGNGRIKVDMCIHGEYTSTPKVVSAMAEYAKSLRCNMHIHLAETKKEFDECIERHGMTPTRYMETMGVFDNPTTAAHCVYLTDEDIAILAQNQVTAAHCPVSNLKLGSGVARIADMQKQGVNITLGTDGCASNNNLNLLEEVKLTSVLHKGITGNAAICPPAEIMKYATQNGAAAQGRPDTGCIKVGNKADFAVLNCDKPYWYPSHDKLNDLVYAAQGTDVMMTVVNGKILYQNGEFHTIDIEKVKAAVKRHNKQILKNLDL